MQKLTYANSYKNTARADVFDFVESLAPTEFEGSHLKRIFAKNSLSMRDLKLICDFIALRASKAPLQAASIEALGVPSLPPQAASEANTAPLGAIL